MLFINIDSISCLGNTPLHHAIQSGNKNSVQMLIVFDADINAQNNKKISVRHEAANSRNAEAECLLYCLSCFGAKRCPPDMIGCNDGCKHNGKFEGRFNQKLYEIDSDRDKFFYCPNIMKIIQETFEMKDLPKTRGRRVNMLCFDGGGIKGLISLQVMIEIEKHLKHPIVNYFRWLVGTSTGSIVAASLAKGRSLRHIRDLYFKFKNKIFTGSRPYSSEALENILKDEFGTEMRMSEFKNKYNKQIIIPAVLFDRKPIELHLFRSYPSPQTIINTSKVESKIINSSVVETSKIEMKKSTKLSITENKYFAPSADELVWCACRASGAAPTYFTAFENFIDGGLIANNPTLDAITEVQKYNAALDQVGRGVENEHLTLVLSIGCGRLPRKKTDIVASSMFSLNLTELKQNANYLYNLFNLLLDEVCNTNNHVVDRAEAACSQANKVFFRINPLYLQEIELDERYAFKLIEAMWETKRYMHLMQDQVKMLVNFLEKTTDLEYAVYGKNGNSQKRKNI